MDNNDIENTITHDIRGQICPSCLLFTLQEINRQRDALKQGKTKIIILTDNRDATATIPDTVSSMGYISTVEKVKKHYVIEITNEQ